MRKMADPIRREMALARYREGYSDRDVAKALGVSTSLVTTEKREDHEWRQEVQLAMAERFNPVLKHATELALKAGEVDEDGHGNYAATDALKLVMQFYSKQLDREHITGENSKKLEAISRQPAGVVIPVLTTPEAVAAYMDQIPATTNPDQDIIDVQGRESQS